MQDTETYLEHASALLDKLKGVGLVDTPEMEEAYWRAPRHRFIDDGMYVRRDDAPSWQWFPCPKNPHADPDWLARIYADSSIAIEINEAGAPSCVNFSPFLVFWLLGKLEVHAGDRVLDIGTGTGQLAAILSRLAGRTGSVVSLEVSAELAAAARLRLASIYLDAPVNVLHADAAEWRPEGPEFDVLIATASSLAVPPGWLAALAPGARASLELRGQVGGALLFARRPVDTSSGTLLIGRFDERRAGFLPLLSTPDAMAGADFIRDRFGVDEIDRRPAEGLGFLQLMHGPFGWYCQLEFPEALIVGVSKSPGEPPAMFLVADYGLDAVRLPFDGSSPDEHLVSFGGSFGLLEKLTGAWRDWRQHGCPGAADYTFSADREGTQEIQLRGAGRTWILGSGVEAW